jgi:hypothetical protein
MNVPFASCGLDSAFPSAVIQGVPVEPICAEL